MLAGPCWSLTDDPLVFSNSPQISVCDPVGESLVEAFFFFEKKSSAGKFWEGLQGDFFGALSVFDFPSYGIQNFIFRPVLQRYQLPPSPSSQIFLPLLQTYHLVSLCLCVLIHTDDLCRDDLHQYLKRPESQTTSYQEEFVVLFISTPVFVLFHNMSFCPIFPIFLPFSVENLGNTSHLQREKVWCWSQLCWYIFSKIKLWFLSFSNVCSVKHFSFFLGNCYLKFNSLIKQINLV